MLKLLEGIVKFRQRDFEDHKDLFRELKDKQKPHTLFITCSDSRIDPCMITKTLPGELFIIRNVANIVPPCRVTDDYVATTSAIEYAVLALEVENIIICGHTNCGGCAAGLDPERSADLPHTRKWLELINPVRDKILAETPEEQKELSNWLMEQGNVVEQLKNLMTFPYIKERVETGKLTISGWHYVIETGEVLIYNNESNKFLLANDI